MAAAAAEPGLSRDAQHFRRRGHRDARRSGFRRHQSARLRGGRAVSGEPGQGLAVGRMGLSRGGRFRSWNMN